MYDLILDSANSFLLVSLSDTNHIIKTIYYEAWQTQSEKMVYEIDTLFKNLNIDFSLLDSVIVSIGPGSYTGVRIALTIAKTLAVALNVKIYPLSSLHILKDGENPSICLINARNNRSYFGVFEKDQVIISDKIMCNDDVKKYIQEHPLFSICGNVSYLGFNNINIDVAQNMFELKKSFKPISNPLALKPLYLKG